MSVFGGAEMEAIAGLFNLVSKAQNSHGWRLTKVKNKIRDQANFFEQCLMINIGMSNPRMR